MNKLFLIIVVFICSLFLFSNTYAWQISYSGLSLIERTDGFSAYMSSEKNEPFLDRTEVR